MPATARDIIKQLISVCPEKEYPTNKNINWINARVERDRVLGEFDFDGYSRLCEILETLLPDTEFVLEFGTQFGTQNIIVGGTNFAQSEVSYYLRTGVLWGMRLNTHAKFQLEEKITLDKNGYHFIVDPMKENKHPAHAIARVAIKDFLFKLYGCVALS